MKTTTKHPPARVTHLVRDPKTGKMVHAGTLKKPKRKTRFERLDVEAPLDTQKKKRPAVVSVILEYKAVLTGEMDALGGLHAKFNDAVRDVYRLAEEAGITILRADGCMRAPTREENIMFVPRKFHMERDGRHLCDVPYVSKRYLVTDRKEVTCRWCQRKLEDEDYNGTS